MMLDEPERISCLDVADDDHGGIVRRVITAIVPVEAEGLPLPLAVVLGDVPLHALKSRTALMMPTMEIHR